MFAALADEVENLPITADSAGLIALLAIRDRLDAVVSDSVAAFDARRLGRRCGDVDAGVAAGSGRHDESKRGSHGVGCPSVAGHTGHP